MAQLHVAQLTDRGVIGVAGADAGKFLQGLVTNDIDKLSAGSAVYAGLLTPQGKILFDFFVFRRATDFLIDAPLAVTADLAKRLGFYKLRAKVEVDDLTQSLVIAAAWGDAAPAAGSADCFADPRAEAMGWRIVAERDKLAPAATASESDYHAHRIALGIPEGGKDFSFGDTFPHEANMDVLNGVDFDKGCFVGQEVVSRMQHRGSARKRVVPVSATSQLPESGSEIRAGKALIGTLGSAVGQSGLALIRLDRAAEAIDKGDQIKAGDVALTLRQPDWAPFKVPTGDK